MKFKIKASYIGLFMIGIMIFSTFAFVALQSVSYSSGSAQGKTALPSTNVIDYELTSTQKNTLISRGTTLLSYKYSQSCQACMQQKMQLQQLAQNSKLSNQIFLELLSSSVELPTLTMTSYYGQRELVNATDPEILSTLCQLLVTKPVECALQQVQ